MKKTLTLSDAQNLYRAGRLSMRVNKRGRIECIVHDDIVRISRLPSDRASYEARSLRLRTK